MLKMGEQEPILSHSGSQEMNAHVRDYSMFIAMMKWGAIISFILAFIVVVFVL